MRFTKQSFMVAIDHRHHNASKLDAQRDGYVSSNGIWGIDLRPMVVGGGWSLTHIPSGRHIARRETKRECQSLAEQLDGLGDWQRDAAGLRADRAMMRAARAIVDAQVEVWHIP